MGEAAIGIVCYSAGVVSTIVAIAAIIVRAARSIDEHGEDIQSRLDQAKAHWGDENQRDQKGDDDPLQ